MNQEQKKQLLGRLKEFSDLAEIYSNMDDSAKINMTPNEAKYLLNLMEAKEHNLFRNFIRANRLSRKWDEFLEDWEKFKKQENIK